MIRPSSSATNGFIVTAMRSLHAISSGSGRIERCDRGGRQDCFAGLPYRAIHVRRTEMPQAVAQSALEPARHGPIAQTNAAATAAEASPFPDTAIRTPSATARTTVPRTNAALMTTPHDDRNFEPFASGASTRVSAAAADAGVSRLMTAASTGAGSPPSPRISRRPMQRGRFFTIDPRARRSSPRSPNKEARRRGGHLRCP